MTPRDLDRLRTWYHNYADDFMGIDPELDDAVRLKLAHTERVRDNIRLIGNALGMAPDRLILAEASALLHDVGRFRQFREHRTFLDQVSCNHARMGLCETGLAKVLNGISLQHRRLICRAVAWHNAAVLPADEPPDSLFFMKLLRDADKLDIYRVVLERYEVRGEETDRIIDLDLPSGNGCSPAVIQALMAGRIVTFKDVKTLVDFKLTQIGWVFDINFPPAFDHIHRHRILQRIHATLPDHADIKAAVMHAEAHVLAGMTPGTTDP
jgi:HD domain